jgi:aspartate/methionine/tyrosine aminotransferase
MSRALPASARRAQAAARIRGVATPIIPLLAERARVRSDVYSFGQGVAWFPPPPAVQTGVETFWQSQRPHVYGPAAGIEPLVAGLESRFARENGFSRVGQDWRVMVTAGANMAFLNALLAITDPGDEVLLPLPCYFNHEMAIEMAGCRAVHVPSRPDWSLDLDRIREAIGPRTRALVTVSPNNPAGVVYSPESLELANALAAEHGLWHLSDETYEYFTYGAARHLSPGAAGGEHTLTLGSFSKAYGMASWRVGYLLAPATLYPELLKVQDTNLICATHIAQYAALAALGVGPAYCRSHLPMLEHTRMRCVDALGALAPRVKVSGGEGAFYLLLELDTVFDSTCLALRLVEEFGVVLLPGAAFGLQQGCTLRLSYGALASDGLEAGLSRLVAALAAVLD